MRKTYAQSIKEGGAFWCNIPDIRVETDESIYYRKSPHYIKVIRRPYMKKRLFRIYESDIETLDSAELFLAPINRHDEIYQVPVEMCPRKIQHFDEEKGPYYIFSADKMPFFYIRNTGIGDALEKIINEEKGKK